MKLLSWCLMVGSVIIGIVLIMMSVFADVEFNRNIGNYWDLADKSSTIERKGEYVDKYIEAFAAAKLEGTYDSLFFPTPSNNFDQNFEALKSLQKRLDEIHSMNPSSFEYQTALQQITDHEFTENTAVISVLEGSWWKVHHYLLWNWLIQVGLWLGLIIMFGVGLVMRWDDY